AGNGAHGGKGGGGFQLQAGGIVGVAGVAFAAKVEKHLAAHAVSIDKGVGTMHIIRRVCPADHISAEVRQAVCSQASTEAGAMFQQLLEVMDRIVFGYQDGRRVGCELTASCSGVGGSDLVQSVYGKHSFNSLSLGAGQGSRASRYWRVFFLEQLAGGVLGEQLQAVRRDEHGRFQRGVFAPAATLGWLGELQLVGDLHLMAFADLADVEGHFHLAFLAVVDNGSGYGAERLAELVGEYAGVEVGDKFARISLFHRAASSVVAAAWSAAGLLVLLVLLGWRLHRYRARSSRYTTAGAWRL